MVRRLGTGATATALLVKTDDDRELVLKVARDEQHAERLAAEARALGKLGHWQVAALVKGNNAFAFDLYRQLSEKQKGNLFLSPYSISGALAMTSAGARGATSQIVFRPYGRRSKRRWPPKKGR